MRELLVVLCTEVTSWVPGFVAKRLTASAGLSSVSAVFKIRALVKLCEYWLSSDNKQFCHFGGGSEFLDLRKRVAHICLLGLLIYRLHS